MQSCYTTFDAKLFKDAATLLPGYIEMFSLSFAGSLEKTSRGFLGACKIFIYCFAWFLCKYDMWNRWGRIIGWLTYKVTEVHSKHVENGPRFFINWNFVLFSPDDGNTHVTMLYNDESHTFQGVGAVFKTYDSDWVHCMLVLPIVNTTIQPIL